MRDRRSDWPSRRHVLGTLGATAAAVGASALAGCNSLPGGDGEDRVEFHSSELPDVGDDPGLALWATYPMSVPQSHLRDAQANANAALEAVPLPLGERRIPNGHVRQHLTDAAGHAREHLGDALGAPTQRASLWYLRQARQHARYAEAGWATIDDGLTEEAVAGRGEDVRSRARDERDVHAYLGTDPVESTVVHASVECLLEDAIEYDRSPSHDERVRVLHVAGLAESVERARASLDDARVVRERYRDRQPEDARSLQGQIDAAATELGDRVRERVDELPSERDAVTLADADIENALAQRVLSDLHRYASWYDDARIEHGPATTIVDAIFPLAAADAYRSVRDRVESGTRYAVEGSEDVRAAYERAHDALASAPGRSSAPGLASAALSNVASSVQYTDEALADVSGTVFAHDVNRAVIEYTVDAAIANAAPAAVDAAVDALDG